MKICRKHYVFPTFLNRCQVDNGPGNFILKAPRDFDSNYSENISEEFNYSTINDYTDYSDYEMGRLITVIFYPVIIIVGTIGNLLTFIVMQRGSLKHSSTCFYTAVLALSDTSKYFALFNQTYLDNELNTFNLFNLFWNKQMS